VKRNHGTTAAERVGTVLHTGRTIVAVVLASWLGAIACLGADTSAARDFVLALDISGSMHAEAKRTVMRETSIQMVQSLLSPNDCFDLITFTKSARTVGHWRVSDSNKGDILVAVTSVEPTTSGWTNIEAAKALAAKIFRSRRRNVAERNWQQFLLMLTDGEATHTLPKTAPTYLLWQEEKRYLRKIASFGKSGVTLALFAFDTKLDKDTEQLISMVVRDQEISEWFDRLKEELKPLGGDIKDDVEKHAEDGLELAVLESRLMDHNYCLDADQVGVRQRFVLRSNFEVGYARGTLKAGITELKSTASGRLTNKQWELDFYNTSGSGSNFELAPHPKEDNLEEGKAPPSFEQTFELLIRLPQKQLPLTNKEKISGTLTFRAKGNLAEFGGGGEKTSQGDTVPLPDSLPVPLQISFVAERDLDMTPTFVLVAGIIFLILLLAAVAYFLLRPITLRISDVGGVSERNYRLSWRQTVLITSEDRVMGYKIPLEGIQAALTRTLGGKLRVRALEGKLFREGQSIDTAVIDPAERIGLGTEDSDNPQVELDISLVVSEKQSYAGPDDTFDWSG